MRVHGAMVFAAAAVIGFSPFLTERSGHEHESHRLPASPANNPFPFALHLARAGSSDTLGALQDGDAIDLSQTGPVNIVSSQHPQIGSVRFFLDGSAVATQTQAPYAMGGDQDGVYGELTLPLGTHTISATAYSGPDGSGTALASASVQVRVTAPGGTGTGQPPAGQPPAPRYPDSGQFISLQLMRGGTMNVIQVLRNGDVVDLKDFDVNVMTETLPEIGSVRFYLDGQLYTTENNPPFAMGGDQGTVVNEWRLTTGKHTIEAVATTGDDGSGSILGSVGVSIEVKNGDSASAPVGGGGAGLRWPRPNTAGATVLNVPHSQQTVNMDPNRDYVIKLPASKRTQVLHLKGGRDITLIGGHISIAGQYGIKDKRSRAIFLQGAQGKVYIEGLLIDSSSGGDSDGIAIEAPKAKVFVQNCRIVGMKGRESGVHADIIQPWGGVKELNVDRLTGSSNYQGFFLVGNTAPVGKVTMSRVNVTALESDDGRGGHMLWLDRYPTELKDFYVQPRSKHNLSRAVYPQNAASGNQVCFSGVNGCVKGGKPPGGDFVPQGSVGANYR